MFKTARTEASCRIAIQQLRSLAGLVAAGTLLLGGCAGLWPETETAAPDARQTWSGPLRPEPPPEEPSPGSLFFNEKSHEIEKSLGL